MKHHISVTAQKKGAAVLTPLRALMKKSAGAVLDALQVDAVCEVNIIYTDDEGIRALNKKFRGLDRPTDVLSFPLIELKPGQKPVQAGGIPGAECASVWLGDIVVSLDAIRRQALEYGHSEQREAAFLIVHGMLHLLGYDHEQPEQESLMFNKAEQILSGMGLSRDQK